MRNTLIGLVGIFAVTLPAWGQDLRPVTTRAFDNSRSGANTSETILTRDNVLAKGIRRDTITVQVDLGRKAFDLHAIVLQAIANVDVISAV